MAKKFTEEQYHKIRNVDFTFIPVEQSYNLLDTILDESIRPGSEQMNMALALTNPLTRELAHDKYVEKEKKYVWRSKITNSIGKEKRLYDTADGISDSFIDKDTPSHNGNRITETEIKKWGYNPEEFYKAEV